jgi:CheY-like chemotaxis protein
VAIADADDEANANRCLEAGAAELLARPIDSRRLKEVLERHLTNENKGEDTPSQP